MTDNGKIITTGAPSTDGATGAPSTSTTGAPDRLG